MDHQERMKICSNIENYIQYTNDEFTEYCDALSSVSRRPECFSKDFETALDLELLRIQNYLTENAELVEEIVLPEPYTIISLRWKDEP